MQDELEWEVDVDAKFCMQGGGAVQGLSAIAAWFGSGISVQDGQFCATGLDLAYTPLQVGPNRAACGSLGVQRLRAPALLSLRALHTRSVSTPPAASCAFPSACRLTATAACMWAPTETLACRSLPTATWM